MEEPSLSFKQWVSIVIAVGGMSGVGGALTVSAQDAVQSEKIQANETSVLNLRNDTRVTREAMISLQSQTGNIESDVSELKEDVKELTRLMQRVLVQLREDES